MKCFVGFLIQEEAAKWHNAFAKEISQKFGTWDVAAHVPPHVTVFLPFDTGDIASAKKILQECAGTSMAEGTFTLSGFGRFDSKVVFADIEADPAALERVVDIRERLKALGLAPLEWFPEWRPHATLAKKLTPEQADAIWDYVSSLPTPHFELLFSHITLFRAREGGGWETDEMFSLARS